MNSTVRREHFNECKNCRQVFLRRRRFVVIWRQRVDSQSVPRENRRTVCVIPEETFDNWMVRTTRLNLFLIDGKRTLDDGIALTDESKIRKYRASNSFSNTSTSTSTTSTPTKSTKPTSASTPSTTTTATIDEQSPSVVLASVFKGRGQVEECSICFVVKRALQTHRDCCDQWLQLGDRDTCVYCRANFSYANQRKENWFVCCEIN